MLHNEEKESFYEASTAGRCDERCVCFYLLAPYEVGGGETCALIIAVWDRNHLLVQPDGGLVRDLYSYTYV